MEIAVFDTYVNKPEGGLMHFDILVKSGVKDDEVYQYGQKYLSQKGYKNLSLTARECKFCHIETPAPDLASTIEQHGYAIIEMQGC